MYMEAMFIYNYHNASATVDITQWVFPRLKALETTRRKQE
jgi:hypothetical protein